MNTFMKKKYASNGPEPYLEKLNGKRLVYSSESAEGIKLDTALIKSLTGGDTLNPRGMYKDPKAFKPTHKLMLFTNYKPKVDDSDNGTWDRILLIPLVMRFVDNPTKPNERKKDKDLGEKLKAEYSGILAWLVRGCLEWRKQGLNPPASVLAATDDYRDGEDELAEFIDDICILGAGHTVKVSALFGRYLAWTRQMGIDNLPLKDFKTRMKRKFGDPKKTNKGWFYQGIS